ncbi:MAG: hypothetical protein ACOYO1_11160 [Bacteroidales bacterium]
MAKQVKTSLDFNKNEIQNVVVQKLAAAPSTPVSGLIYYDTVLNCFRYYNGTAWISCKSTPDVSSVGTGLEIYKGVNAGVMQFRSLEAGADGSIDCVLKADSNTLLISVNPMNIQHDDLGGYAFSHGHMAIDAHIDSSSNPHSVTKAQLGLGNVTNDAQLKAADLDIDAAFAANSDAKIASQRATKAYVDNKVSGVTWKESVRAATIANITLSGTQSVDGVTLLAGDRVLVKNQTTAATNGIYIVSAAAWSRAADNDTSFKMVNATVLIQEGTTQADTQWTCSTNLPITLGTTAIAFAQMSGAGTYAAGDGMTLSGNSFAVNSSVARLTAAQTLTNKTIDADNNTVSNLETDNFKLGVIDTDNTLAGNSDVKIPTQKAVKGYADTKLALKTNYYKGTITATASGTITAATHGCGTAPHAQVFEISGASASLVEVDIVFATATGDVTWTASAAFTGYIVIIGK